MHLYRVTTKATLLIYITLVITYVPSYLKKLLSFFKQIIKLLFGTAVWL